MSAPSILTFGVADQPCCEDETWKRIPDWPHHEASTCGRVRSTDRLDENGVWRLGAILPQHPDRRKGKGYLYAILRDGKRRRKVHVAVAVLEAHRGLKPGPRHEACHSGPKTDNHLVKLRWDTKEANLAEMWEARRLVTAQAGHVTDRAFPQDGALRYPSRHGVTGDGTPGTGRFPSFPRFPPHFTSLNPALRMLRSIRSSRRAA